MFRNQSLRSLGRRSRAYEDIHFTCTIQFLDESDSLSVNYQRDTKGQFLVDYACQHLDLIEKDYFGLYYNDSERQRTWLDPNKCVQRQLKGTHCQILSFGVKFYPSDPTKLKEEITRYHVFLQLKRDLQSGALLSTVDEAVNLSAYIVQAELGDYDAEEHLPNYISSLKNLPLQIRQHERELVELHKNLTGQTPAEAEANFLKAASELPAYGMIPYCVTDVKGNNMHLGITHQGIATFQNNKKTHTFRWSQIRRFSFDGRMFLIRLFNVESDDSSLVIKQNDADIQAIIRHQNLSNTPAAAAVCGACDSSATNHSCGFKCSSVAASRNLWKCAVEQQYFFTLQSSSEAPKVTSSGGLFHKGSKFKFSGRCEQEVYNSIADINRTEPTFQRSRSNAEFSETYGNLRSATLPASWRQVHGASSPQPSDTSQRVSTTAAVLETNIDESSSYYAPPTSASLTNDIMDDVIGVGRRSSRGQLIVQEVSQCSVISEETGSSEYVDSREHWGPGGLELGVRESQGLGIEKDQNGKSGEAERDVMSDGRIYVRDQRIAGQNYEEEKEAWKMTNGSEPMRNGNASFAEGGGMEDRGGGGVTGGLGGGEHSGGVLEEWQLGEAMLIEERFVKMTAHECGSRDDVIPSLSPSRPIRIENGLEEAWFDHRSISMDREERSRTSYDHIASSSNPPPQRMTYPMTPPCSSSSPPRLSLLANEIDAQIADLRSRLEKDLMQRTPSYNPSHGDDRHDDDDDDDGEKGVGNRWKSGGEKREDGEEDGNEEFLETPDDVIGQMSSSGSSTSGSAQSENAQQHPFLPPVALSKESIIDDQPRNSSSSSSGRSFLSWRMLLAILVLVVLVVAVLVLEIRADFPVITDIRLIPEVEEFRVEQYLPVRQAVIDFINDLINDWMPL